MLCALVLVHQLHSKLCQNHNFNVLDLFVVPNDCHLVHYGHEEVVRAITNIAEPEYEEIIQSLPQ